MSSPAQAQAQAPAPAPAANAAVYQPISGWYTDRSLLVTGATGFMGKVLVEKLLRSCRGVRCIYLLIRPKRGQGVADRLQALLDAPLFDKLRTERPSALGKIVPIQGDVTEPELGISPSDRALLVRNVSVVFHSAATVKFDEALRLSVTINMLGTKRLVELCHQMLSLEALVHVSTAYCNCDREEVREMIYPPPYDPEHIMQCMQWMDEDLIQSLTPKLIGKRPNTYTFTKALAESMLLKECGNLPVAIVRPSIVLSSWKEPMAGWVDNWNGPTGIIAAAGKGFFRTMLCHENKTADLVPVDLVINLMIAAAWKTATKRPDGIAVYNCCTGQQNAITWKMFVDNCFRFLRMHPLGETMWYPDGRCRSNQIVNKLFDLSLHVVPAHVIDLAARVLGKKPIMVRVQTKLSKAAQCLEYFSTQQWRFVDDNVQALNASLSVEDRATFCFDVRTIDWPRYLEGYVLGIRHFIFKEHPSTLPAARKQLHRLYWMHRLAQLASILFVWRILMSHSKLARKMWLVTLELIIRIARLIPYV